MAKGSSGSSTSSNASGLVTFVWLGYERKASASEVFTSIGEGVGTETNVRISEGAFRMSVARIFWCSLLACVVFTCAGFWMHDGGTPTNPSIYATANQITHDGLAKTAVLSDGYALYVAEEKD